MQNKEHYQNTTVTFEIIVAHLGDCIVYRVAQIGVTLDVSAQLGIWKFTPLYYFNVRQATQTHSKTSSDPTQQTYLLLFLAMVKTLLDLPSEIRMEIYSYLLITETAINPFSRRSSGTLHLHPAILRTCEAIYKEAAAVLTQGNLFIYQSYHSAAHYKALPPKSDRSWTIVKRQFHCAPTYAPAGPITSRSHPIRHLEIRLNGEIDYQVAMAMLSNVLVPHNTLKTLELEMWDIWERNKLQKVLTKMAGSPDRVAVSIKIFERSWPLELERGCDRLRESIMEWNQTSERRYVETKSEMTTEQWGKLWVRGCYRVRRWNLSPRVAQRWSEMQDGVW